MHENSGFWRRSAAIVSFWAAAAGAPAAAQGEPKIDNPAAIPPSVRPGAIEAQLETEIAPGVTMAPSVVSPYETEQPEGAADIVFRLAAVELDGATAIPAAALSDLYAEKIGAEVSLSEIFAIARAITARYAAEGYPLSLAYVPAQEIDNGAVRIRIVEGYIGEIDVDGADGGLARRLRDLGDHMMAERPLTQASLERYLLLANRIPGVSVTGVLARGAPGAGGVKMTLKAKRKRLGLAGGVNNRASRAVGREQFYGKAALNGLATGVDGFNFMAIQSVNLDELTVFIAGYSNVLTTQGLTLNLSATRSEAAPGVPFLRDLGFETQGWTAGASLAYPLILRRDVQLTIGAGANWKEFRSAFGVSPNTLDVLWTTEFSGALTVKDGLNGVNALGVAVVRGWDVFDATEAGSPLASRQGAGAEFVAVTADLARTQKLTDWADATLSFKAQTANNPLLSSEQCGFGGAGFGRGYDPFEIVGDRCIVGLFELRASPHFLSIGKLKTQAFASIDGGAVRQIGALAAGEDRNASLYSFGAGLRMSLTEHLSGSVEVGVPLKGVVAQEGDDDPRIFFGVEAKY